MCVCVCDQTEICPTPYRGISFAALGMLLFHSYMIRANPVIFLHNVHFGIVHAV